MKTAAAYVRVSTERQDEYSLDSQLKLIRDYAAAHDMDVPPEFVFVEDGVSGRSAKKRPSFQRMVALAKDKAHPFDVILVWKFSRFARNQEESIVYKSMLSKLGVDVISVSEPLDDSPFGSLIERIIEWMDEFYSIRLSGEVKRGMAEKVSRAEIVTVPSFGYDVRGKTYVPNAQADTVRRIFADYLSGKGLATIARELTDSGVRTRRGSVPSNRWIRYILRNPVYIGKIRWSKDGKIDYVHGLEKGDDNALLIDGGFEPIIDADTFAAVQAKLEHRAAALPYTRHDQQADWMLKGLVRCSSCGSTLVYTSTACPTMQCYKYAHGSCSTSHSLSIAKANRLVVAELENAAASCFFPLAPQMVKKPTGPDYDHLIAVEELKLRRVAEAYEAGVDTLEDYARKKAKLTAGIEDLKAQQAAAQAEAEAEAVSPADMRRRVLDVLQILRDPTATEQVKNASLREILSHIIYDKPHAQLQLFFAF
ncbi:MAG: recombinase family protein [Oscillospiraceae bacterium]|nr:recombinase family protein [Oscillospiraceae bacterium]